MAFLQPAPVVGRTRTAIKRLAHQLSRTSPSSLAYSTTPTTRTRTRTSAAKATFPFICQQCTHTARVSKAPISVLSSVTRTRTAQHFRNPTTPFARCLTNSTSKKTTTSAPTFDTKYNPDSTASGTNGENAKTKSKSFPETSSKSVAYWLLGSAASVFGIVVFGGLTRLTESGYAFIREPEPPIPTYLQC